MIYVETYVGPESTEEEKASAVMMRLRGWAFRLSFNNFSGECSLGEEGNSYAVVKSTMPEEFSETNEHRNRVGASLELRLRKAESMRALVRKAVGNYRGTRFSQAQALNFLSRAV